MLDAFGRTVDDQNYNTASSKMSYGGNYGSGTRNVDMTKTEADLAVNIRKATSIGVYTEVFGA